jgi:hypothetical protein
LTATSSHQQVKSDLGEDETMAGYQTPVQIVAMAAIICSQVFMAQAHAGQRTSARPMIKPAIPNTAVGNLKAQQRRQQVGLLLPAVQSAREAAAPPTGPAQPQPPASHNDDCMSCD